jgi:hypothetical protein
VKWPAKRIYGISDQTANCRSNRREASNKEDKNREKQQALV